MLRKVWPALLFLVFTTAVGFAQQARTAAFAVRVFFAAIFVTVLHSIAVSTGTLFLLVFVQLPAHLGNKRAHLLQAPGARVAAHRDHHVLADRVIPPGARFRGGVLPSHPRPVARRFAPRSAPAPGASLFCPALSGASRHSRPPSHQPAAAATTPVRCKITVSSTVGLCVSRKGSIAI